MILGIMGAMPDEVDQLCAKLENVTVEPYGGVEYHKGTLAGKQTKDAILLRKNISRSRPPFREKGLPKSPQTFRKPK